MGDKVSKENCNESMSVPAEKRVVAATGDLAFIAWLSQLGWAQYHGVLH